MLAKQGSANDLHSDGDVDHCPIQIEKYSLSGFGPILALGINRGCLVDDGSNDEL